MKQLDSGVVHFFQEQGCVIVSTVDQDGQPHNSCKGIIKIKRNGQVYLFDLYKARTYNNLKHNPRIGVTAVDEHKFRGYCLKGKAKIIAAERLSPGQIKDWEDRVASRITRRLIRNIRGEKGHSRHPEAFLPQPEYMIVMQVEESVDLTPHSLKEGV